MTPMTRAGSWDDDDCGSASEELASADPQFLGDMGDTIHFGTSRNTLGQFNTSRQELRPPTFREAPQGPERCMSAPSIGRQDSTEI